MEEILEAEVVAEEEVGPEGGPAARPLPAERNGGVPALRGEARTVAIAAAGGIVAGAATVAVARAATRAATPAKRNRRRLLRRGKSNEIVASRSFLVDVHLLGR